MYRHVERAESLGIADIGLSANVRRLILGAEGSIPRSWVDTRNYYTHWDEDLRPSILEGEALYWATLRLEHLLRALYWNLIGVPPDAMERALQGHSRPAEILKQAPPSGRL